MKTWHAAILMILCVGSGFAFGIHWDRIQPAITAKTSPDTLDVAPCAQSGDEVDATPGHATETPAAPETASTYEAVIERLAERIADYQERAGSSGDPDALARQSWDAFKAETVTRLAELREQAEKDFSPLPPIPAIDDITLYRVTHAAGKLGVLVEAAAIFEESSSESHGKDVALLIAKDYAAGFGKYKRIIEEPQE